MFKTKLSFFLVTIFFLVSCSKNDLSCNNDKVKDTLTSIISEEVKKKIKNIIQTDDNLYNLVSKFDFVSTKNKNEFLLECSGRISYSYPSPFQGSPSLEIDINYDVKNNEMDKGSFLVTIKDSEVINKVYKYQVSFTQEYYNSLEKSLNLPNIKLDNRYGNYVNYLDQNGWKNNSKETCNVCGVDLCCQVVYFKDGVILTLNTMNVGGRSLDKEVRSFYLKDSTILKYLPLL